MTRGATDLCGPVPTFPCAYWPLNLTFRTAARLFFQIIINGLLEHFEWAPKNSIPKIGCGTENGLRPFLTIEVRASVVRDF